MNKYTAAGLSAAAYEGRRILVLEWSDTEAHRALNEFRGLRDEGQQVRTTAGAAQIAWPSGGVILFRSIRSHLAGVAVDTVFLDGDCDRELRDWGVVDRLRLHIHASPHGEIVRA